MVKWSWSDLGLDAQLVGQALFILQQAALRVLQLLQGAPEVQRLRRGRALVPVLRGPSVVGVRRRAGAPADGGPGNHDPHGLQLRAGVPAHLAQVQDSRRRGSRTALRRRQLQGRSLHGQLGGRRGLVGLHAIAGAADSHI